MPFPKGPNPRHPNRVKKIPETPRPVAAASLPEPKNDKYFRLPLSAFFHVLHALHGKHLPAALARKLSFPPLFEFFEFFAVKSSPSAFPFFRPFAPFLLFMVNLCSAFAD